LNLKQSEVSSLNGEVVIHTVPSSQRALVGLASPKQSFKITKLKYETLDYIVNQWSWANLGKSIPPALTKSSPIEDLSGDSSGHA